MKKRTKFKNIKFFFLVKIFYKENIYMDINISNYLSFFFGQLNDESIIKI